LIEQRFKKNFEKLKKRWAIKLFVNGKCEGEK